MIIPFIEQSPEFIQNAIKLHSEINISELYLKESYQGEKQQLINIDQNCVIIISQSRLYENCMPYKTNCTGEIIILITDYEGYYSELSYSEFLETIKNY